MTAAIALAVVLVIAVAGASMALESQRGQSTAPRVPRPPRPSGPSPIRRPRARSGHDPTAADGPPPAAPDVPDPELKGSDLLRTGESTEAKVISVVDERTIGPVTRSRLTLRVEPTKGPPFEATVRIAFQTPQARSRVRVGGTVPVRYDPDDPTRVVVELPQD
ncbi:MAG: hypothetical protein JO337_03460 [Acidimicrobiales bacterium]|nr:hypothetical protein [Acidimicrobiales bacterium]